VQVQTGHASGSDGKLTEFGKFTDKQSLTRELSEPSQNRADREAGIELLMRLW